MSGDAVQWAEVGTHCDEIRFRALSKAMNDAGFTNQVSFITGSEDEFATKLNEATAKNKALRLGGSYCLQAARAMHIVPRVLMSIGAADSLTPPSDKEHAGLKSEDWWPRCFLADGLLRLTVTEIKKVDLGGGVFILGTGCEARAAVSAMIRLGFSRFTISDLTGENDNMLMGELRAAYFQCQFQFVSRHLITQLPSVHSVAINTLVRAGEDDGLSELYYLNFLKPNGVWLDFTTHPNPTLEGEARALGSTIESGIRIAAWTDCEWASEVFKIKLDPTSLALQYETAYAVDPKA